MRTIRITFAIFSVAAIILNARNVFAQDYPNKPIRIIVTGGPGGSNDFAARMIAQALTARFGRQVIVDNRPTAVNPGQLVSQAPPNGYTLLVTGDSLWILPLLKDVPFDPVKDFLPITMIDSAPNVLVLYPSVAASSVKELIDLAKARPGALNYASSGVGSPSHMAAELFKSMAGINIVHVPYKGAGLGIGALIGGEVQVMFPNLDLVSPHTKAGRLRALAITSEQPSALFPGLPTVAASGLPGYEAATSHAMLAPAKTPVTIINRLNKEVVSILNTPDIKEKFLNSGTEVTPGSPEKLAAKIASEMARLGKVIKDAGIRAE